MTAAADQPEFAAPGQPPRSPAGPPASDRTPSDRTAATPALTEVAWLESAWASEDEAALRDEQLWASDPADWPDDLAAWPGGQEALPEPDHDVPTPEGILLALDPDVGPPGADDGPELTGQGWERGTYEGGTDERGTDEPGSGRREAGDGRRQRETFAAGFTHRDAARWGREYAAESRSGFAAGCPADTMEPGPVLARLVAQAWDEGLAALSDDELIGVMSASRRLCSWQAALEFATVTELDVRRMAQVGDVADPRAAAHTSEELAAALILTGRAADTLLDLAAGLARLPAVAEALARGLIDRARAVIFIDELAALGDADAAAIAAKLLPRAGGLTTGQLRAALRRAVIAFDPEAAKRRREQAAADARVETWAEGSGNSVLAGRELSPAGVVAADRHVSALARALKAAGADGTMDRIRAAVFLALLSGRSPDSLLPLPSGPQPEDASAGERGTGPDSGSGLAWPDGPLGTVHLTMPLASWLGLSDAPGAIGGLGPADSSTCRELAADLSGWASCRWCLTITSPDGRALGHACTRAGPPGHDPPGHDPPGHDPPGQYPQRGSPPGAIPPGMRDWLAGLKVEWLETGACTHQRETAGYRPGARLRHLVKTRNPTCSFPGCRRAARRCDDDHTVPFDQGGRTCECNLAPLCRRHHRAKQARGWHLEQPQPGILIWTAPHRRQYVTRPEPYPV